MPRGFNTAADLLSRTADGVSLDVIYDEFENALEAQNSGRQAVSALFSFNTVEEFALVPTATNPAPDFEDASEFGVPQAIRGEIDYLRMGFPLEWKDIASRFTEKFLRDATAEEVRYQFSTVLERDNRLVFIKTMSALTDKATAGNRRTTGAGVQVFDLWDGSTGEVPPTYLGRNFTDAHSHYLVSGATTLDSGDIEQLIETVREHGFGLRSSGEQLVLLVHPDQAKAISSWRAGQANANGAVASYDFIAPDGGPAYLTTEFLVGARPASTYNGLTVDGAYNDALIHSTRQIPSGYVIAVATSGAGSSRNPLAFRQHRNNEWQGLLKKTVDNHPLRNSYFQRGLGVGVRHRSAAAVLQIKASGSYENPTWP